MSVKCQVLSESCRKINIRVHDKANCEGGSCIEQPQVEMVDCPEDGSKVESARQAAVRKAEAAFTDGESIYDFRVQLSGEKKPHYMKLPGHRPVYMWDDIKVIEYSTMLECREVKDVPTIVTAINESDFVNAGMFLEELAGEDGYIDDEDINDYGTTIPHKFFGENDYMVFYGPNMKKRMEAVIEMGILCYSDMEYDGAVEVIDLLIGEDGSSYSYSVIKDNIGTFLNLYRVYKEDPELNFEQILFAYLDPSVSSHENYSDKGRIADAMFL